MKQTPPTGPGPNMNDGQSKAAFLVVGAMFSGVWALSAFLAFAFCLVAQTQQHLQMPHWMQTTFLIMGIGFSFAGAGMLWHRRRILSNPAGLCLHCGRGVTDNARTCPDCGSELSSRN